MLVDDDSATNFLNRSILKRSGIAKNIQVANTVNRALELLGAPKTEDCRCPELIFLDLNMPGKTGWDFLSEYSLEACENSSSDRQTPVIVVLTSSPNPEDRKRAQSIATVREFRNKPLSRKTIDELMERYFT